ncbi:MAG: cation:proton antiporter [Chloroflexi bacterium]|nr:MAG: cation:proton antiporter [Chloroflexota bacterium]
MEHNPVIPLFIALAVIIIAARIAGTTARRMKQPRVLGELLVGVLLGPTLLDMLHWSVFKHDPVLLEETIHELAEIGVLLLMFKVGLEVHIKQLLEVGVVAAIAGVIGALLPVAMTMPLVMLAGEAWQPALFTGVALAATSVSISAQVLLELGVLQTKEGNALLATALVDDVVAILLISLTIAITGTQGSVQVSELVNIVLKMTVYLVVASLIAWFILPRITYWMHTHPANAESFGIPAVALAMAFAFGWSAEIFGGIAAITGAFIAGVGLSRNSRPIKNEIELAVNNIAYAFVVPIFFVSVGLKTDLSSFPLSALPFTIGLLLVAVSSKVIGCGLGAKLGGFNNFESLRVGVCMISRGEVGLIIAALGITSGVYQTSDPLFAALFMVILLTTVLTPVLVRWVFKLPNQNDESDNQSQTSPQQKPEYSIEV